MFVKRKAEAANFLYGRRVLGGHSKQSNSSKSKFFSSSFHSSVASRDEQQLPAKKKKTVKSFFCDIPDHLLQACLRFIEVLVADRLKFVKSKKLCFKCLSSRHRIRFCGRQNSCTVEGCEGTFTTLFFTFTTLHVKMNLHQVNLLPFSGPVRVPFPAWSLSLRQYIFA